MPTSEPPVPAPGASASGPSAPGHSAPEQPDADGPAFRLGYVPGATPGKWAAVWRDRLPDVRLDLVGVESADVPAALVEGRVDAAIARLPVDADVFSAIPLYEEVPVVCVSRDHLIAALDADEAVGVADLADETVWLPLDDVLFGDGPPPGVAPSGDGGQRPATTVDALAVVAANVGVVILPQSVARLHHRKDVVFRRLEGGPGAPVGLVWPQDRTTDLVEEMIGIVRGRTVNSSRGRARVTDDAPAASPARRKVTGRSGGSSAKGARPTSGKKGDKRGKGRR